MLCQLILHTFHRHPDSKDHGANMGPTWVLSAPGGPHVPCYQGRLQCSAWYSYFCKAFIPDIFSLTQVSEKRGAFCEVKWGPTVCATFHIFFIAHDDVIKWRHFPCYWPFVRGIHRSPVPSQRPVKRCFDVFFDLRLNKRLSKQSWGWWFETPSHSLWRHCNEYNMQYIKIFYHTIIFLRKAVKSHSMGKIWSVLCEFTVWNLSCTCHTTHNISL